MGADAGYGKGPGFCIALDRMGETFVVDLHSDFPLYLEDPKPYLPERTSRQGRNPARYRTDAKSECGMTGYQVRKWSAWHHHMALVMMAMLFMLNERISHEDTYPLFSCSDIVDLLSRFLPRRDVSKSGIIRQLEYRHRKRLLAIKSHMRISEKTDQKEAGG